MNDMEIKTIGTKIKQIRKRRNMTQSAVAGDKITRNMLSRIENGTALPSLDTLEYISIKLEVPMSYLLSDGDDLEFYKKKELIDKIYRAYDAKNYKACIDIIKTFRETDNELNYICANAYFELAHKFVLNGAFSSAGKHIELALEYCEKTKLNTDTIKAKAFMYFSVIKNVQSPLLEFEPLKYMYTIQKSIDIEFFKYLTLDFNYPFETPAINLHMDAKKFIKERNFIEASKLLLNAAEILKKDNYNAFVLFGIYTDLEYCYKQLYDYENAYLYSSKRMTLLENFNT